ncbi:MAG: hypothetical protein JOY71_15115 [Acetobacteraceae bacterium]|nr:hypothetical protein [Acetobacteraceae bacterium]
MLGSRGKAPATFSYNIAVAQSRAGQPDAALETARSLRAELARRGASSFPELDLVEATALYRTGKKAQADAVAARVQTSGDADAASRASFLRGLIADDTGDVQGLKAARRALGTAASGEQQADAAELDARLLLRTGNAAAAKVQAESTAEKRRELLDYRRVARALALAAASLSAPATRAGAAGLSPRWPQRGGPGRRSECALVVALGLDVHEVTIAVAIADSGSRGARTRRGVEEEARRRRCRI